MRLTSRAAKMALAVATGLVLTMAVAPSRDLRHLPRARGTLAESADLPGMRSQAQPTVESR